MVYDIVSGVIKPIYIPPDVVDLIIGSSIINTNPLLIKNTLQNMLKYPKIEVKSLRFNKDSYINLNYTGEKLSSNYTIEFWLKKDQYDPSYPSMSILNDQFCALKLEQYSKRKNIGLTKYSKYDKIFNCELENKWTHITFSCSKDASILNYTLMEN
eukprot:gene11947-5348_t